LQNRGHANNTGVTVLCSPVGAGLSHEDNMHKMRVLTFVQIAEGKSELSFETIENELQLQPDEVEAFIIDGELPLVEDSLKSFDTVGWPTGRVLPYKKKPGVV